MKLIILKHRHEFLRVRGGNRWGTPGFDAEGKMRAPRPTPQSSHDAVAADVSAPPIAVSGQHETPDPAPRFGLTVTKKVGNAVIRNRIRRRLRDVLRQLPEKPTYAGYDFVLFARQPALHRPFLELTKDLEHALERVTSRNRQRRR